MNGYYGARPGQQRDDHLTTRVAHTIEHDVQAVGHGAVALLKIWKTVDHLGEKALEWAERYHAAERGETSLASCPAGIWRGPPDW